MAVVFLPTGRGSPCGWSEKVATLVVNGTKVVSCVPLTSSDKLRLGLGLGLGLGIPVLLVLMCACVAMCSASRRSSVSV